MEGKFGIDGVWHVGQALYARVTVETVQHAVVGRHINHLGPIRRRPAGPGGLVAGTLRSRQQIEAVVLGPDEGRVRVDDVTEQGIPGPELLAIRRLVGPVTAQVVQARLALTIGRAADVLVQLQLLGRRE